MTRFELRGARTLVTGATGATGGIGQAIAVRLPPKVSNSS